MNQIDLSGRTAVITGAANGIGRACAERLVRSGARVSLWDINGEALAETVHALEAIGSADDIHAVTLDCADETAAGVAARATLDHFPLIDICIANAGIAGINKPVWEYTLAEWDRLIRVDLTSVFLTTRAFVPHMVDQGYGRIVIVSSIAGLEGAANNAAYSAAKAGAIGYTKALGKELATTGVLVNGVAPSGIDTPLLADITPEYLDAVVSKMPMSRLGRADESAALIAWLCSEDCSFSTGAIFDNSGGRAVY